MVASMNDCETKLDNGLRIRLKEIHTAPIISHWIWYRVGSRDEVAGKTGISHWVEHMQFKGTEKFPGSVLDKVISRDGGYWNAFTNLDWTAYYQVMPADKSDVAFQLEADRMVNSRFDPQEVNAERTVIISEREGNENEPLFHLTSEVQKAAFRAHGYNHDIIGEMEDLKSLGRDDLYRHYRQYYVPNNALVAVAGDFDTDEVIKRLKQLYGEIPEGPDIQHPDQVEPPLRGEKRVEVKGPGGTTYLQVAYRSPKGSDPDFFALTVVDSLLSGPSNLNMFGGGGVTNRTSRLYQALVEKEYAIGINGNLQATIDPFLYSIITVVHPNHSPEEVLARVDDEIERLQNQTVEESEIARAVKQARAIFAYGSESITNQAFWAGYPEMFASYDWFLSYIEKLEAVTPIMLQEIAQKYLVPQNRVVGTYIAAEE
jgi:zinc protease